MPRHKQGRSSERKVAVAPAANEPRSFALVGLAVILLATCIVYSPAMNGRPLWDDDAHLTKPELQSIAGLYRIWFEPGATQQYYPLLHSAFWLEHKLWGDSVRGYHAITLLWHLVCLASPGPSTQRSGGNGFSRSRRWQYSSDSGPSDKNGAGRSRAGSFSAARLLPCSVF